VRSGDSQDTEGTREVQRSHDARPVAPGWPRLLDVRQAAPMHRAEMHGKGLQR